MFVNGKKIVEVGTCTGYSSTSMVLALPAEGHVICGDVSEEYANKRQEVLERGGRSGLIKQSLRLALEALDEYGNSPPVTHPSGHRLWLAGRRVLPWLFVALPAGH